MLLLTMHGRDRDGGKKCVAYLGIQFYLHIFLFIYKNTFDSQLIAMGWNK